MKLATVLVFLSSAVMLEATGSSAMAACCAVSGTVSVLIAYRGLGSLYND